MSEHQIDQLLKELSSLTGSLGKITASGGFGSNKDGRASASEKLERDMYGNRVKDNKALKDHFETLIDGTKNSKSFSKSLLTLAEGTVALGGIFSVLKTIDHAAHEYVDTYRSLNNVGETFGGSMLKMTQQAAAAGLPLEEFAQIVKNNGVAVKQYGIERFADLNMSIRKTIDQYGDYGLTIEQIGEGLGKYMNLQRLAGVNLSTLSNEKAKSGFVSFLDSVSASSQAFGTNREEAMKDATELLEHGDLLATERLNTINGMSSYNQSIQNLIGFLSGASGGKELAKGMADTIGSVGGAVFTDFGKSLVNVGLSDLVNAMDDAKKRIAAGENEDSVKLDVYNKFADRLSDPATIRSLQTLATAGDEGAKQILTYSAQMKHLSGAEYAKAQEEAKQKTSLTALYTSFASIFETLKGSFINGFLSVFTPETTQSIVKELDALAPQLKNFGTSVGVLLTRVLTPQAIEGAIDTITGLVQIFGALTSVVSFVVKGISLILTPITMLEKMIGKINKPLGELVAGFIAVAAFFGAKHLLKMFGALFGAGFKAPLVNVKGGIVNVSGGLGLGGGLGGGGKGAGRAATAAEEVVEGAGAGAGAGGGAGGRATPYGAGRSRIARGKGSLRLSAPVAPVAPVVEEVVEQSVFSKFLSKLFGRITSSSIVSKLLASKMAGSIVNGLLNVKNIIPNLLASKTAGNFVNGLLNAGKFGKQVFGAVGGKAGEMIAKAAAHPMAGKLANTALRFGEHIKAGLPGMLLMEGLDYAVGGKKLTKRNLAGSAGGITGGLVGAGEGALAGAAIGSVLPIVGTAVGGFLGGMAGGMLGYMGGEAAGKGGWDLGKKLFGKSISGPNIQDTGNAKVIDDQYYNELQTESDEGDVASQKLLADILSQLQHHTAILASNLDQQKKTVQATKASTKATQAMDGSVN